jgi:hypothetical protein
MREKVRENQRHTAGLNALDGSIGNSSVNCLSGLLEGVDSRLLEASVGAEEASAADDA